MSKSYQWYQKLLKPSWAPPAKVFGPVWTVLYVIIAISYGFIGYQFFVKGMPFILALPFLLNLIFNLLYTPIQFRLKNLTLATIDILLILSTLVWAMGAIYPFIKWVAIVNIPYLVWVMFATMLQVEITLLNRQANKKIHITYTQPMIKVNDTAPLDIVVADKEGKPVSLRGLLGTFVVLYAFPKDGTPGCIKEACSIRDVYDEFKKLGISVIGISADSSNSHIKFSEKYALPFPLWSDSNHELLSALGAWGMQKFMGKSYMGVARTTFLINKQGAIIHIWEKVKPDGHAEEILTYIEKLLESSNK